MSALLLSVQSLSDLSLSLYRASFFSLSKIQSPKHTKAHTSLSHDILYVTDSESNNEEAHVRWKKQTKQKTVINRRIDDCGNQATP